MTMRTFSLERLNNVLIIRLINTHENYTFSETLVQELNTLFDELEADMTLAAVIITGGDKFFCTGGDLHAMLNPGDGMFGGTPEEITQKYQQGIQRVILRLHQLPMPTLAAINGAAVGAGLGLALACDMRFAAPQIKLAESFTRIGLIAGDGDAWLLSRLVGYAQAAYLLFTSDFILSEQAKEIGLINAIFDKEALMEKAMEIATRIASHPLEAVRAMKKLLQQSSVQSFAEHLQQAAKVQGKLHHTVAHREKVAKLL